MNVSNEIWKCNMEPFLVQRRPVILREDWYVVVDFCPVFLSHALCNPDDIPALLFLEFEERVEHAEVELLHKRIHVQFNL